MLAVPFVYFFYCFSSRAPKNQKNISKWLLSHSLLANLLTAVPVPALFDNKLAFFLFFKTTPDYFKCIPLETKGIWFSLHWKWVFVFPVAKETEQLPYPGDVCLRWQPARGCRCFCVAPRTNSTCTPLPHSYFVGYCFMISLLLYQYFWLSWRTAMFHFL